jgi:hypothetical protein
MSEQLPALGIVYRNDLDPEPIEAFAAAVRRPGLELQVGSENPPGPMVGIEWYLPTAVLLIITQGFFGEVGKDAYVGFKRGMLALWKAYLSRERTVHLRIVATEGKVDPDQPYSHTLSIYSPTAENGRIKFLFQDACEQAIFECHVVAILNALEEYHAGKADSLLQRAIRDAPRREHTYLVRYNEVGQCLEMFDPLLEKTSKR